MLNSVTHILQKGGTESRLGYKEILRSNKKICLQILQGNKFACKFLQAESKVHFLPASAGDASSIPGLERSPGEGNGNLLQYSCLEKRSLAGWQKNLT